MKKIIISLMLIFSITYVKSETVLEFQQNYSGITCFENGVLTIQTSGYLKIQGKGNEFFIWDVDPSVNKIVIEANTIVNAAFHYSHGLDIIGMDRQTSILFGTSIQN